MKTVDGIERSKGSHVRTEFICDCGNTVETTYRVGIKRRDCGECWKKNLPIGSKTRMLTLLEDISEFNKSYKALWRCDCGLEKRISIKSVLNGLTSSCGCKQIKAGVGNCDKRKKTDDLISTKSLSTEDVEILDNKMLKKKDCSFISCKCKCGNLFQRQWNYIYHGSNKSCGRCGYIKSSDIKNKKYGNLTVVKTPLSEYGPYSEELVECRCQCGKISKHRFKFLYLGQTTSCGRCSEVMDDWWKEKPSISLNGTRSIENKYSLEYLQGYFKGSKLEPQHGVSSLNQPIAMKCLYCGGIFTTRLSWTYTNKTRSCGCITNGVSRLSRIVQNWFPNSELEFKSGKYSYDLKVGEFLIECHGLRYHSTELRDSRNIDKLKRKEAADNGFQYLMFYEDELKLNNGQKVKKFLEHRLGSIAKIKIRPQKLEFREVSVKETRPFLDNNHYIGSCGAKRHFAAYLDNQLLAVMLFSNPVRQNIVGIELTRFCVHPKYQVYGLGSWMFKRALQSGVSTPVISFSDNRLHSGELYKHIGFVESGQVRQDYYWVKNNKRHHKSALRKPKFCDITEAELRSSEGYHKIWDLGKTRWIFE